MKNRIPQSYNVDDTAIPHVKINITEILHEKTLIPQYRKPPCPPRKGSEVVTRNQAKEVKILHREPTQSVCVADCYFVVNVLDLPFASPIAIYR